MENNNKKSRALIITIGVLVVLVGIVFLIYKNQNIFGVKNSSKIAKIFSPLETSKNQKKELMRAGEDISRGDGVMISEYGDPNTVIKSNVNDFTIGFADNDMSFGDLGSISLLSRDGDGFWNSFSKFLGRDIGAMQCNDKKDNDGDGKTDKDDPECHIDGDINKEYLKNHDSEKSAFYESADECLDIENYPITYTDDEAAQLDTLLRKFYLIAPTLFSAEDIAMVQRDMDEYENLSNQVTTLTQQCYSDFSKDSYKGPKTRYGNPWYKPEDRGSYLSNEDSSDGKCVPNPYGKRTAESCAAINKRVDCERDGSRNHESGCVWVKGDLVKDFEAILNIW